jgi:hypothetical protein
MGREGIRVRVLGLASTTHGFAYALTEGPRRLVDWKTKGVPVYGQKAVRVLDDLLIRSRPLFVAFDRGAARKKRNRGRSFGMAVKKACQARGIMILGITSQHTDSLASRPRPNKWDVADAIVKFFPDTATNLPPRRKPWQSEDDRIGLFMALAAAVCAWEMLGGPRR